MKCSLMNKNTQILTCCYDTSLNVFTEIYSYDNISYAPVIIYKSYKRGEDIRIILTKWFKGRGIPSWRDDLDILLHKLDIMSSDALLDKAYGLSLSDQYWLKEYDSTISYSDINFFDHDFKDSEFRDLTFGSSTKNVSLITPNNTTDGRLKKVWMIDGSKRYLLKGGYKNEVMQPFNEVLASMICKRLSFNYTDYSLEILNGKVLSKCECFINSDTEFVTAYQILSKENVSTSYYETYINILEEHGIKDARVEVENMVLLDYIIMNEDRHLNNFGIIRDVNTLEWLGVAPIFDNGQSLNILDYNDGEILINGDGRFFYDAMDFDSMISNIKNISRFNIDSLNGLVDEFYDLLNEYSSITHMSDRRMNKICNLLNSRINKLKLLINVNNL